MSGFRLTTSEIQIRDSYGLTSTSIVKSVHSNIRPWPVVLQNLITYLEQPPAISQTIHFPSYRSTYRELFHYSTYLLSMAFMNEMQLNDSDKKLLWSLGFAIVSWLLSEYIWRSLSSNFLEAAVGCSTEAETSTWVTSTTRLLQIINRV